MNQRLSRVLQVSRGAFRATTNFFRKRFWLIPLVVAVVLALLGWGVFHIVRDAMRTRLAEELTTIRDADVTALRLWLKLQQAEAESLAKTPLVRQALRD